MNENLVLQFIQEPLKYRYENKGTKPMEGILVLQEKQCDGSKRINLSIFQ